MLCCVVNGNNTITGNLIGVGPSGSPLGNNFAGILIDRSRYNVVGPGNVIAHNIGDGILFWADTPNNTTTQSSIHDNGGGGIIAITSLFQPPVIINFDITAGTLSGVTWGNCVVEIISDASDEGEIYEGRTEADEDGAFIFARGDSLTGPNLTTTTTTPDGTTTLFAPPTQGTSRTLSFQVGNALSIFPLQTKRSDELADNRTGASFNEMYPQSWTEGVVMQALDLGLKRVDVQFGDGEPPIDWSLNEYELPRSFDGFVDALAENGIAVNYMLHFWDTAGHAAGEELGNPRFQNYVEVQEFVDYVRFFVRHFKGRIPYYTIWSEPDYCGGDGVKCILPEHYIVLSRVVIPVIRQEDPGAKVISAPYTFYNGKISADLFTFLTSDVMSQFDIISLHPIYEVTPDNGFYGNFYYEYPAILQEIKQTAFAQGFKGELWGTELSWNSVEICDKYPDCWDYLASDPRADEMAETELLSAKYYSRGIVMQLGLDVGVGINGFGPDRRAYPTVRNLNTVTAGNNPLEIPVEIESDATHLTSYGFSLPNGDRLLAVWNDNIAVDYDPCVPSMLTFPDTSVTKVIGIDVLHGFEQELIFETVDGNLLIRDLLIKDYPIILQLSD